VVRRCADLQDRLLRKLSKPARKEPPKGGFFTPQDLPRPRGQKGTKMPEKELVQYWLPAITALWGGTVGYLRQVQKGKAFHFAALVMHLSISGFSGLMFWLLSVEYQLSQPLAAVVTGMAGYMGGEAIKLLEARAVSGMTK
jgi:hypothetical protein